MWRLALLLPLALAIYSDQVSKFDWSIQNLGKITHTGFTSGSKWSLLVASEKNQIAALNMKGEVIWRTQPYHGREITNVEIAESCIVTTSDSEVSAWNTTTGNLIWSHDFPQASQLYIADSALYIANSSTLRTYKLLKGLEMNTKQFSGTLLGLFGTKQVKSTVEQNADTLTVQSTPGDSIKQAALAGGVTLMRNTVVTYDDTTLAWFAEGKFQTLELQAGEKVDQIFAEINTVVTRREDSYNLIALGDEVEQLGKLRGSCTVYALEAGVIGCVEQEKNEWQLRVYTSVNGQLSDTSKASKVAVGSSKPEKMWGFVLPKGQQARCITAADHSYSFVINEVVVFRREEALASPDALEIFDVPLGETSAHNSYFESLQYHNDIWNIPQNFAKRVMYQIDELSSDQWNIQYRSEIGKILLMTTRAGKAFGLDSDLRRIIWQADIGTFEASKIVMLEHPVIILDKGGSVELLTVNLVTGEFISRDSVPNFTLAQALVKDHVLYMISADLKIVSTSKTAKPDNLFFYTIETREIRGYKISQDLVATPTWTFNLSANESIHTTANHSNFNIEQPAIASNKLIYKHLDRNMVAVATLSTRQLSGFSESDMIVYLICGVSGRVLSKVRHEYVSGNVELILAENWVIAHYWQYKYARYEFLTIELYDHDVDYGAEEIIQKYMEGLPQTYSSFTKEDPVVITKTYSSVFGAKALASTITQQGITRKDLLMIMNSGQVYSIDKRMLSARRRDSEESMNTYDDAEIPPYKALLPIQHTSVVNYDLKLYGLTNIYTTWTYLESTSLVAAYGCDLFVATVQPEKSFDTLTDDFSQVAIILTLIILLVGNVVAKKYFAWRKIVKNFSE